MGKVLGCNGVAWIYGQLAGGWCNGVAWIYGQLAGGWCNSVAWIYGRLTPHLSRDAVNTTTPNLADLLAELPPPIDHRSMEDHYTEPLS